MIRRGRILATGLLLLSGCIQPTTTARRVLNVPSVRYPTIAAAVYASRPGDSISVSPGVYHEHITFPRSGAPGAYIRITGQPGAVLDGSDPAIEAGGGWAEGDPGSGLQTPQRLSTSVLHRLVLPPPYFSTNHNLPRVWRDSLAFYEYDNADGVRTGIARTPYWSGPVAEGWSVGDYGDTLWVRSLDDPALHVWHVCPWSEAFYLARRDYIWIEGFAVRFYRYGVFMAGSSHCVIERCAFQTSVGVHSSNDNTLVADSTRASEQDVCRENSFYNPPQGDWPYLMTKATHQETAAIEIGTGHVWDIGRNDISFQHDGIQVVAADSTDIYDNKIHHLSDDGIEADQPDSLRNGAYALRIMRNTIDDVNNAISLAPITAGPVFIGWNTISRYRELAFKGAAGVDWPASVTVLFVDNVVKP